MHVHDPSSGRTWTGTASPTALVIRLFHPPSHCPWTSMSLNHHIFKLARCCMKIEYRAFPQDCKLAELSGMLNHHDIWCSISTILFRSPQRSHLACRIESNQASLGNLLRRQETSPPGSTHFLLYILIPTGHTKTVRAIVWSPSGWSLATTSFNANIGIWKCDGEDVGDEEATILEGHETECKSIPSLHLVRCLRAVVATTPIRRSRSRRVCGS